MTSTPAWVLAVAASQLGTTEHPPGSNRVLYFRWYADAVGDRAFAEAPWCARYVSRVFDQAGASALVAAQNAHGFAWCQAGVSWFSRRGALATTPQRGWALAADGGFGPATCSVVRQDRAEKGLTVDGVVGPRRWVSVLTSPVTA